MGSDTVPGVPATSAGLVCVLLVALGIWLIVRKW